MTALETLSNAEIYEQSENLSEAFQQYGRSRHILSVHFKKELAAFGIHYESHESLESNLIAIVRELLTQANLNASNSR